MQESLAGTLHEVVGLLDRSAAAILKRDTGMSYRQYYVLSAVATLGQTNQHDLAEHIGHSDAAVSRMLTTLSRAGHVTVTADPAHRRRNNVALTPTGVAVERRASVLLDTALAELLQQRGIDGELFLTLAGALRSALRDAGWSARPLQKDVS